MDLFQDKYFSFTNYEIMTMADKKMFSFPLAHHKLLHMERYLSSKLGCVSGGNNLLTNNKQMNVFSSLSSAIKSKYNVRPTALFYCSIPEQ